MNDIEGKHEDDMQKLRNGLQIVCFLRKLSLKMPSFKTVTLVLTTTPYVKFFLFNHKFSFRDVSSFKGSIKGRMVINDSEQNLHGYLCNGCTLLKNRFSVLLLPPMSYKSMQW